jgi:hypothetical protein
MWVILYTHILWGEMDEINHVIMHSRWIYWCLVWRYMCMICNCSVSMLNSS